MVKTRGIVLIVVAVAGLTAAVAARYIVAGETEEPCCFTNQRFKGVCQVAPAEDESCGSILAYLNNPKSSGKVYCGRTDIRGGWQQVSCE